jgi:hypothetical protein
MSSHLEKMWTFLQMRAPVSITWNNMESHHDSLSELFVVLVGLQIYHQNLFIAELGKLLALNPTLLIWVVIVIKHMKHCKMLSSHIQMLK